MGCDSEGVTAFKKAVEHFNTTPPKLDLSKFPPVQRGFYSFQSASNLVGVLPHRLCDTEHEYEINCFDAVILLTKDRLRADSHVDERAGPFVVQRPLTNGTSALAIAATPSDAFKLFSPEWYLRMTDDFIPKSLSNERAYLAAAIFRYYVVPDSTPSERIESVVMKTLDSAWKKLGLVFPKTCELVLCHQGDFAPEFFPTKMFGTTHAGVLFRNKRNYVYLEKTGGSGPFVRLDFDDRKELITWLAAHLGGEVNRGFTDFFVSFNNSAIERLNVNVPKAIKTPPARQSTTATNGINERQPKDLNSP